MKKFKKCILYILLAAMSPWAAFYHARSRILNQFHWLAIPRRGKLFNTAIQGNPLKFIKRQYYALMEIAAFRRKCHPVSIFRTDPGPWLGTRRRRSCSPDSVDSPVNPFEVLSCPSESDFRFIAMEKTSQWERKKKRDQFRWKRIFSFSVGSLESRFVLFKQWSDLTKLLLIIFMLQSLFQQTQSSRPFCSFWATHGRHFFKTIM